MGSDSTSIRNVANGKCVRCGAPSIVGQIVGGAPGVVFYPEASSDNPPDVQATALFQSLRFEGFACPDCGLAWFETSSLTSGD